MPTPARIEAERERIEAEKIARIEAEKIALREAQAIAFREAQAREERYNDRDRLQGPLASEARKKATYKPTRRVESAHRWKPDTHEDDVDGGSGTKKNKRKRKRKGKNNTKGNNRRN